MMPLKVSKRRGRWLVKEPTGKVLGTHGSKAKAQAQVRAINVRKHQGKK